MDFNFTPEQLALKAEFDEFFKQEEKRAPENWIGGFETRFETEENWEYYRSCIDNAGRRSPPSFCLPR